MPTPEAMVEVMLDMARVSAEDVVVDLGSGDGRLVIAAAKRGARARGVEYNPDMVQLSKRRAREADVQDRATFVEGDMFEADIGDATVMAVFLLTENMRRLQTKFLSLRPGTRIVSNTFGIPEWPADARITRAGLHRLVHGAALGRAGAGWRRLAGRGRPAPASRSALPEGVGAAHRSGRQQHDPGRRRSPAPR